MINLGSILKSRDIILPAKVHIVKALVFPVVVYGQLDHKESWAQKNWSFQIVGLEKTLESPLDCKEIQLVNPKGNQSWIFTGRTDAEAETPILWPPDSKNWLLKRPWCWERVKAGGEGNDRGWDGWMASRTMGVSLSKLWELVMDRDVLDGQQGVLQSLGSQRVSHDWATELNWLKALIVRPVGNRTEFLFSSLNIILQLLLNEQALPLILLLKSFF